MLSVIVVYFPLNFNDESPFVTIEIRNKECFASIKIDISRILSVELKAKGPSIADLVPEQLPGGSRGLTQVSTGAFATSISSLLRVTLIHSEGSQLDLLSLESYGFCNSLRIRCG